jgi:hypothetical protein
MVVAILLNNHNPLGNKKGDVGKIKASFKDYFKKEIQRHGISTGSSKARNDCFFCCSSARMGIKAGFTALA